jgi:hypothetical protein
MERVILPPPLDIDGGAVGRAWAKFAQARALKRQAVDEVDAVLAELSGVEDQELEFDAMSETIEARGAGSEEDESGEDAVAEESGSEVD